MIDSLGITLTTTLSFFYNNWYKNMNATFSSYSQQKE